MKRVVFVLLLGMAICCPARAHILKIDGNIGVLMHIDPDDSPAERDKATFFFDINDRTGRFGAQQCDCRLRVLAEGREVLSSTLSVQGPQSAAASYSFPAAGMYRVEVSGAPQMGAVFHPFRVAFDVRVERNEAGASWSRGSLRFWPLWTVLALILAGFIAVLSKNK